MLRYVRYKNQDVWNNGEKETERWRRLKTVSADNGYIWLHLRGVNRWRNWKHRLVEIFVCACRLWEKCSREFLIFKNIILNLGFHLKIFPLRADCCQTTELCLRLLRINHSTLQSRCSAHTPTERLRAQIRMEGNICSWPQCPPVGHHSRSSSK